MAGGGGGGGSSSKTRRSSERECDSAHVNGSGEQEQASRRSQRAGGEARKRVGRNSLHGGAGGHQSEGKSEKGGKRERSPADDDQRKDEDSIEVETRGSSSKQRMGEKSEIRGQQGQMRPMSFRLDESQESMERMRDARDAALRGARFLGANIEGLIG